MTIDQDVRMTETMDKGRIAVIGGGASGCMAAIAAANAGCSVTVFEKNEKIAKKIYATGNGRCNLTNLFLDASCYHTREEIGPSRILSAFTAFSREDLLCFFAEAGLPVHDRDGYVYPRTDQAETVAKLLEKQLRQKCVRVLTSCAVKEIEKNRDTFCVRYCVSAEKKAAAKDRRDFKNDPKRKNMAGKAGRGQKPDVSPAQGREEVFFCDAVILCTGGLAGPSFGCSGDGYRFAQHFSHSVISPLPALTRLECTGPDLRRAAGVRCHARVTLFKDGAGGHVQVCEPEEGEVQITESGISGIPVFQLSTVAAELLAEGEKVFVSIDFLPEFSSADYEEEMRRRLAQDKGQMLADYFLGLAHRKVIDLVLSQAGLQAEMKARRFTEEQLKALLLGLRSLEAEVTATGGFDHAQVTSGGVPLSETEEDFSSKKCPGLYLAGELLDVDGRCGGYNLQWAMSGGSAAGRAAALYVKEQRSAAAEGGEMQQFAAPGSKE